MSNMNGYMTGINLGGWISQYGVHGLETGEAAEHFATYITKEDIALIAAAGFDHIRVPVDYKAIVEGGAIARLKDAVAWAKEFGLNSVIDLHDAPGYHFFQRENTLFDSPESQDKLAELWRGIAEEFKGEGPNLRYELLNEIKDNTPDRWNDLAERLIGEIRAIDQAHYILVGGINMNSIRNIKDIRRFADDKIVYNFHSYDPFLFTHQRAAFEKLLRTMDRNLPYPCPKEEYNAALTVLAENAKSLGDAATPMPFNKDAMVVHRDIDKEYLREIFAPAIGFVRETGLPLYCGEFGAIENADAQSRANYVNDIAELCIEYGIGRAMWNYKEMDFKLVDRQRNIVSDALMKAAAKK